MLSKQLSKQQQVFRLESNCGDMAVDDDSSNLEQLLKSKKILKRKQFEEVDKLSFDELSLNPPGKRICNRRNFTEIFQNSSPTFDKAQTQSGELQDTEKKQQNRAIEPSQIAMKSLMIDFDKVEEDTANSEMVVDPNSFQFKIPSDLIKKPVDQTNQDLFSIFQLEGQVDGAKKGHSPL
jgi:hypothetical protein